MYTLIKTGDVEKKQSFLTKEEALEAFEDFYQDWIEEHSMFEPQLNDVYKAPEIVGTYFEWGAESSYQSARIEETPNCLKEEILAEVTAARFGLTQYMFEEMDVDVCDKHLVKIQELLSEIKTEESHYGDPAKHSTSIEDVEWYEAELRGQKFLFSESRIDLSTVPEGFFAYEVRATEDGSDPCEIREHVAVNFFGTIIGKTKIGTEKLPWDETDPEHGSAIILKFSDTPEYFDNENGITDEPETDGVANEPHYCVRDDEFSVYLDYDIPFEEYVKEGYLD